MKIIQKIACRGYSLVGGGRAIPGGGIMTNIFPF